MLIQGFLFGRHPFNHFSGLFAKHVPVFGLHNKVLVVRGYGGGFFEKLLEAPAMSNRVNAKWVQDGHTTGPA